jgi:hypothetical protein
MAGFRGKDVMSGGDDNDEIFGDTGSDNLDGIDGEVNNDFLDGGTGTDTCESDPDPEVDCEL